MNSKVKFIKFSVLIFVVITIILITVYLFPIITNLSTEEGRIIFKEKVKDSSILGIIILFGLQIAQMFLFFIPGEPIEILSGMCYGEIYGTLFIMVSAFLISTTIFLLVRKYGKKLLYLFLDKSKVDKVEKSKIFNDQKRIEFILFILFFIPGTPKDFLVYIAGLTSIKPLNFIIISTFARLPSIISSTFAGANLLKGSIKLSIIMYALIILIAFGIIMILRIFDKDKIIDKSIKEIK